MSWLPSLAAASCRGQPRPCLYVLCTRNTHTAWQEVGWFGKTQKSCISEWHTRLHPQLHDTTFASLLPFFLQFWIKLMDFLFVAQFKTCLLFLTHTLSDTWWSICEKNNGFLYIWIQRLFSPNTWATFNSSHFKTTYLIKVNKICWEHGP